jgi:phosphonopyruvate decarboxylase
MASTVSYPVALQVNSLQELEEAITQWKKNPELTFVHLKISQGSPAELGRPTVKPFEVKDRLIQFIG